MPSLLLYVNIEPIGLKSCTSPVTKTDAGIFFSPVSVLFEILLTGIISIPAKVDNGFASGNA